MGKAEIETVERDINIECKLLLGKPILIEKVGFLYPLTINEIIDMGVIDYYQLLSLLTYDIEEIQKIDNNLTTLDYIIKICSETNENKITILNFLSFLFREQVNLNDTELEFYLGDIENKNIRIIDLKSYESIIKIIMLQNCFKKQVKKSDKILKFEARLAKMRKKYHKEDNTTLVEIISAISAKHPSINLLTVGGLTIYQLYDQLSRLNMIESYEFNFQAMCNGASSDDAKTKHWSSRIDKE